MCFGLAFKPNVDDIRESPALSIVLSLINCGLLVSVVDPYVTRQEGLDIISIEEGQSNADIGVLLVKHKQFTEESFVYGLGQTLVLDYCGAIAEPSVCQ